MDVRFPTVDDTIAPALSGAKTTRSSVAEDSENEINPNDIAIVGMALRVPGSNTPDAYWQNLKNGVESIRSYTEAELLAQGVSEAELQKKNYVRRAAPLDEMEMFDGEFFGFSPKESAILDPQHRHFYEVAWEALENAAHPPETFTGPIGVWAGCGMGSYFYFNLCTNPELVRSVGMFLLRHTGNDKDFLATRVSYLLDLRGPAVGVQTACSTSLVAIHYAVQSLLAREVDMAVAGGVTIELPHRRGYHFQEGEILSPDGHCHAFDHRAQGTVFGSGAGAVVLRRLEDAIADGDVIHGVIRGTAINNDGSGKVNYLAPSVDGQARCMTEAYALADVSPDTIDYVECHGTGTYLGDPIEVAALTQAFRKDTKRVGYCRIGSVKTNIGHLDTAAGVASFVKATLSLRHRQMPPSLSYEKPNPTIDFETSPFLVNDRLRDWPRGETPRRAAVNSLGVGGTNAHVVLEEAPARAPSGDTTRPFQLLTLSAKNATSLDGNAQRLASHVVARTDQKLADVAFTLHHGRRHFEKRRVVVASTHEEAQRLLSSSDPRRVFSHTALERPEVAFLFPGGGAQYAFMGRDLYAREPVFREHLDRGLAILRDKHGIDLAPHLLGADNAINLEMREAAQTALEPMPYQLPAIFLVEWALAQLWLSWGVTPKFLLGHSLGENTAACLAGVFSFEDALGLVALRGRLFAKVPGGAMLSVNLPRTTLEPLLPPELDVAVINVPDVTVVSGPLASIDALAEKLTVEGIEAKKLAIPVAAHSRALEPILGEFERYLRSIKLSAPKIPFFSNKTGQRITDAEATDPAYWVQHLRSTVRFSENLDALLANENVVVIEVGPGRTLASLAKQHPQGGPRLNAIVSLRHRDEDVLDDVYFLTALGRAWGSGVTIDWSKMWPDETRQRVELPTYAFHHQYFFIQPGKAIEADTAPRELLKMPDLGDWGRKQVWEPRLRRKPTVDVRTAPATWLLFADRTGLAARLREKLVTRGQTVVMVYEGDSFAKRGDFEYSLAPERGREGYLALLRELVGRGLAPRHVAHFWLVTEGETFRPGSSFFHQNQERGFYSLLFLAQAVAEESLPPPLHLTVFTNGMQGLDEEAIAYPEKRTVLGPVGVIPRELTGTTASAVDIVLPRPRRALFGGRIGMGIADPFAGKRTLSTELDRLADLVEREVLGPAENSVVALRESGRFEQDLERVALDPTTVSDRIAKGAVVMITGGLGGLGLLFAEHLARTRGARLALLSRSELPPRETWDAHVRTYGSADRVSRQLLKIQELEALGAEVLVVSADVTIEMEMSDAVRAIIERFGRLDAVLHTAGVVRDGLLSTKTQAECEEVFTPKIHGTLVLDRVLADHPRALVVLFSSTSALTRNRGQVDYVAANAFLDAFALARNAAARAAGQAERYVSLAWGIWNDVGMAHDAMEKRTKPSAWTTLGPASHLLLDARQRSTKGQLAVLSHLHTSTHWLVDEHRTSSGLALVPGTGYLELARAALDAFDAKGPFEVRDLLFLKALAVDEDQTKDVRIVLTPNESGYGLEVRSEVRFEGHAAWDLHAQAQLVLSAMPTPARVDLAAIEGRCKLRRQASPEGLVTAQEAHLRFGARWRVLREVQWGRGEAIAELSLDPRFESEAQSLALHPALLDIATGYAMDLIEGYDASNLWVPVSYERVRVHRPLPARIRSHVRIEPGATQGGEFASFAITLTDLEGNVAVEVSRFTIKKLPVDFDLKGAAAGTLRRADLSFDEEPARELSPAEEQLQHNLGEGILAAEGVRVFEAALASREPHVVVSSLDLAGLVAQADEAAREPTTGDDAKFARPNLDSEYVAPRDDIERTVTGLFQDLLGVDMVGVKDSFFDLGGHSLIAVRLFAAIKKTYQVEFAISLLFEAPTAERIAARVREKLGITGTETSPREAAARAPEAPRPRFAHLVAMHGGSPSTERAPFFLVAGMFGNVLNLRHLAHLVGTDREFYGLQARGLYGDEAPHATFEEMANAYIDELRVVRPHGPYLLGGFSGGGITAYEMARMLRKRGEEVALLVFLDTPVPLRPPLTGRDRALIQLEELKSQGPAYLGSWAERRVQWELAKLRKRFEEAEPDQRPDEFHNEKMEAAFRDALGRYHLESYPGDVTLFRPKLVPRWVVDGRMVDKDRHYMSPDNGWTPYVRHLDVVEVPGDHDAMVLEPNVRVLARKLRKLIERVEAESASAVEVAR